MRYSRRVFKFIERRVTIKNKLNCKIIVPFFNDLKNFQAFINEIDLLDLDENYFLLFDNGSQDKKIEEIFLNNKSINKSWSVLRSENNLGFGGGILHASKFVEEDYICWMPGNMKIKPIEAIKLIADDNNKKINLLVKAKRVNRPILDSIKTKAFGLAFSFKFKKLFFDLGGTPNIIEKNILLNLSNPPQHYSFDAFIYYFAVKNKFKVKRPKISYTKRLHGNSHWQNGISSELKLAKDILSKKKLWDSEVLTYIKKYNQ